MHSLEQGDEKTFQKNIQLWAKTCPKAAFMLSYVQSPHLSKCLTKKNEANLKVQGKSLHSPSGAATEAAIWFKSLPLKNIPLVCIYGVGLGYYYEAISLWLKKDRSRRVVFMEDDAAVIQKLLHTKLGTKILKDPQVQLLYFEGVHPEEAMFDGLYWNFAMTRLIVTSLKSYAKRKAKVLTDLRHKIAFDAAMKNALVDEYMRYGANYYINLYQNMLCLQDSYLGNRFFGKFQNVPAIICGAGPSLAKNLGTLKSILNKAVVFAGGSALNVVNSAGFQPSFGAGIDPNPAQYTRMSMNQGYEVPFFYRNRMYHKAFKMIHGPRLYITGSGGYDTAKYFEEKLGIDEEDLDEGHNVVNFCVEVAHAMGCNPIIFVGMDLSFTGMKEYAPGVIDDASVSQSEILNVEEDDSRAILKTDIFGNPTYTLWKWVAESEWIGDYAKSHPMLTMINCTEGGLGFPGIMNRPLLEVSAEYLKRSFEFSNRIHGETQNSSMHKVSYQKIQKAMKELSKSLKKGVEDLNILIKDAEDIIEVIKQTKEPKAQSGRAALAETELFDEPAYKYVLAVFNEVYVRILSGNVHEIQVGSHPKWQRLVKKFKLGISHLRFLTNVSVVNHELIDLAIEENEKLLKSMKNFSSFKSAKQDLNSILKNQIVKISQGRLIVKNLELTIDVDIPFTPAKLPKKYKEAQKTKTGHTVRTLIDKKWNLSSAYLEKNGVQDGQALSYYPDGKIKEEVFCKNGELHGPCKFWDIKGELLAISLYLEGKQEGQSLWYYPSGCLYSVQRFKGGLSHGLQEYFYEDGNLKTRISYERGEIMGEPVLLLANGMPARQLNPDK